MRLKPVPGLLLTLLALAPVGGLAAASAGDRMNQPVDESENDSKQYTEMMEDAAKYRAGRASAPPSAFDNARALELLNQARELLATGHEIRGRWRAERAFEDVPYSKYAGEALRLALECAAIGNNLAEVRKKMLMLWLYLPDYQGMGEAMERALGLAEDAQDFASTVNLAAENPKDVINLEGRVFFNDHEAKRIFRFLSIHGDRVDVAPRGALGLARGLLLSGDTEDLITARRSYEKFLEDWPTHALTFTGLCEYALSHLVAYRGEHYDLGTLVFAAAIVEQAAIETKGNAERTATVEAYRTRIRRWHQDRDLAIGRWYVARGSPKILQWLTLPSGLADWAAGARRYYQEVIAREGTSPQGRTARAELDSLPRPAGVLGEPTK